MVYSNKDNEKKLGSLCNEVDGAVCIFMMQMDIFYYELSKVKPFGLKPILEYFKEFFNVLKTIGKENIGNKILENTEKIFKTKSNEICLFMLSYA